MKNKKELLNNFPELKLTSKGDLKVKDELIKKYKIIDFHTHIFESICGYIPAFIRTPHETNCSFFDNSAYPGGIQKFNFNCVGYKRWAHNIASVEGLKEIWYNSGFPALRVAKNATIKRLIDDMKELNIEKSVILPINSEQFNSTEKVLSLELDNNKTIIFGSLHPYENNIDRKIDTFIAKGIKGFKINPHIMNVDINNSKMIELIIKLSKTGLPIISCSGYQIPMGLKNVPRKLQKQLSTQKIDKFKIVLDKIKNSKFIFAHGGLEENKELVSIMKDYPNTYTDISTQTVKNIKNMIEELGVNRLLFGSDYPYLSPSLTILSVLKATDSEIDREKIFSENANNLLNIKLN